MSGPGEILYSSKAPDTCWGPVYKRSEAFTAIRSKGFEGAGIVVSVYFK